MLEAQPRLDGLRGRGRDGEAVRVDGREVAGEVDDAEQLAGVGVVDRRRRARPALHDLVEVLGPEDLDGVVGGDRGADRVRARAGLAPQRALGEVHVVGGAQAQARAALDAQQHAVGVGDDDEVLGVVGDRRRGTRGSAAPRGRAGAPPSAAASRPRRRRPARAGGRSGRCRPRPSAARSRRSARGRRPDRRPVARVAEPGDEPLPREAQLLGPQRRRRSDVDGQPGLRAHLPPDSGQRRRIDATGLRSRRSDEATVPHPREQTLPIRSMLRFLTSARTSATLPRDDDRCSRAHPRPLA